MLLNWWRRRAEQRRKRHVLSPCRRLAFERLEERCLLSAKPIPLGTAGPVLPDQPGNHSPAFSLLADNERLSVLPLNGYDAIAIENAWQADLLGVSARADINEDPPDDDGSQQAPSPDNGEPTPDEPNDPTSSPSNQGTPANDGSRKRPAQNSGNTVATNTEQAIQSGTGGPSSGRVEREFHVPLGDGGGFSTAQSKGGIKGSFANSSNLLSDGFAAASGPVSPGNRDLGLSAVTLSRQGKTGDAQDLLRDGRAITAPLTVLANPHLDGFDAVPVVDRMAVHSLSAEGNPARHESRGSFETDTRPEGSDGMDMRWLSGNWTEPTRYPHAGEAVAYAETGAVPRGSLNAPSLGGGVDRVVTVSAGVGGTDHGSLVQVHSVSVGTEAHPETPELLLGNDNHLVEKTSNGMNLLANPLPVSEVLAETNHSPSAELIRRYETLSFGITSLASEADPLHDFRSQGTGQGQDLPTSLPSAAPGTPLRGDGSLSLRAAGLVAGFELFQYDVTPVGTGSGDGLAATTGTTAVALANEDSSLWSILATYALVIVPRQRRYQPTIMVVDHDDAIRDALSVVLVRAGYFVLPAASVRDAWGMVRTPNARIDLVLMDPHLPDISGIHLCARLREHSPMLPVMVCAGEVEPAEVAQLQQLGVRYYLRKPIAFEELLHAVKAILL